MKALPVFVLLAVAAPFAARADSFRCGSKLVHDGDTPGQVLAKCGKPSEVQHSSVLRRPTVWIHGRPVFVGADLVEVPVELWTYNLGPNKFMRRLRFEDGLIVSIETLDYGYTE